MSTKVQPLRVAVVGAGTVVTANYLPYLRQQPGVTLGLYNRTPEGAQAAARDFGGEWLPTLEALAEWGPDTVLVLNSERGRLDVVLALLRLGIKQVFCEKPLVAAQGQARVSEADFHDARLMLAQARHSGCRVAMNFNFRGFDQTVAARRIVAERDFGSLIQVAAQLHYACWSHCIDLIHQFGGPAAELSAVEGRTERQAHGMKARDVAASFRLQAGAVGAINGTAGMAWQHPLFELILTFERGRVHLRDLDGELEVLDARTRLHERLAMVRDGSRWDAYRASFGRAMAAYLDTVRQGAEPPVSGLDGLRELQFEAALRRSIAQARTVQVQDELPLDGTLGQAYGTHAA